MPAKVSINQFSFKANGYGHYFVTYTTQGGKTYNKIINDMTLIDSTKNSETPTSKSLNLLRKKIQEINY